MKQLEIKTLIKECGIDELSELERELVEQAKEATRRAYAPYSNFQVGAAILMGNGKIVMGSNQENAAYTSGLCAERTALFYAASANAASPVKKIAVAAWTPPEDPKKWEEGFQKEPISPCGACRQALLEYEKLYGDIEVILYGRDKIYILPSVASLLPLGFTEF